MSTRGTLRLATRGSALARRQAFTVKAALEDRRYAVELVEVETTGDRIRDELIHRLGKTGAFVRSLDERVLDGDVDGAIHSMKDMPTEAPEELIVAGIPKRGEPGDGLVSPSGQTIRELPDGAVVGTSSLRRSAQLRAARDDLVVEPLRGNVDSRVEKLLAPSLQREHERRLDADDDDAESWFEGLSEIERQALGREVDVEYDAIVLALAGLERAGLDEDVPVEPLPMSRFIPAPGQGALAVTAVDGSEASEVIHDAIDHPRTRVETTVERVLLSELGGGCIAPIGIYAIVRGEHVHAEVQVLGRDADETVTGARDLPIERYVPAAREFAADLTDRGAAALIDEARSEANGEGDAGRADDDAGDPEVRTE